MLDDPISLDRAQEVKERESDKYFRYDHYFVNNYNHLYIGEEVDGIPTKPAGCTGREMFEISLKEQWFFIGEPCHIWTGTPDDYGFNLSTDLQNYLFTNRGQNELRDRGLFFMVEPIEWDPTIVF